MGPLPLDRILWCGSSLLAGLVVFRLFYLRLFLAPFRALAIMFAVIVVRDVGLFLVPYHSHAYTVAWEMTLPALLAIQIWTGYDTVRAVAALYPRVGSVAIPLFLGCLAVTVIACCLGLPFELRRVAGNEAFLRALFLLHRWIDSWITGTLMLVTIFFAFRPAPLKQPPPNLVIHTVLLTTYFAGYSVLYFTENLVPLGSAETMERLQACLISVLYLLWATRLSSNGQKSESWPQLDIVAVKRVGPNKANRVASGS